MWPGEVRETTQLVSILLFDLFFALGEVRNRSSPRNKSNCEVVLNRELALALAPSTAAVFLNSWQALPNFSSGDTFLLTLANFSMLFNVTPGEEKCSSFTCRGTGGIIEGDTARVKEKGRVRGCVRGVRDWVMNGGGTFRLSWWRGLESSIFEYGFGARCKEVTLEERESIWPKGARQGKNYLIFVPKGFFFFSPFFVFHFLFPQKLLFKYNPSDKFNVCDSELQTVSNFLAAGKFQFNDACITDFNQ